MTEIALQRWKTVALVALAVIVVVIPLHAWRALRRSADAGHGGPPSAVFVGSENCSGCHREAFDAWRGSHHDRAMAQADSAHVRGDFDDATFSHAGVTTRFLRRDGGYWVQTDGPDGAPADYEVACTFGWEPLQQYLVRFPGGRLQALSVAWDTEQNRWFHLYPEQEILPDDWLHWTRGAQNWNSMCAECHSTDLRKNYDPETRSYATTWSEFDVACEACHGPGSSHVAWAEIEPMARSDAPNYDLLLPNHLTSHQQVELCAPCHSRRAEIGEYDHARAELMDAFLPALLSEGLYYADGQIRDEVYVYGSFLQSKMYHNDVRCSDCHDVHSLRLRAEGNALCLQCHRGDTYDTADHHFHKQIHDGRPSDGALCIKCHMMEQPYMVVDWRADHSFRVPRPDLSTEMDSPNACNQIGCHADRSVAWASEAYRDWYGRARRPHYGTVLAAARRGAAGADDLGELAGNPLYPALVRATALSRLGTDGRGEAPAVTVAALADDDPLVRQTAADALLVSDPARLVDLLAPLLLDPVRGVRLEAASRLAGISPALLKPYQRAALAEAVAEYRAAMDRVRDQPHGGFNLGVLAEQEGRAAAAESFYRESLAVDELFVPAQNNLAMLLNRQGRNREAATLLRDIVTYDPERYEAHYSLGLLLVEMGRAEDAVEHLRRAAQGLDQRPRVHYNLGLLLQQLGANQEAEAALRRAVALRPDDFDLVFALAAFYAETGSPAAAAAQAERMVEIRPADPRGHQIIEWARQQSQ